MARRERTTWVDLLNMEPATQLVLWYFVQRRGAEKSDLTAYYIVPPVLLGVLLWYGRYVVSDVSDGVWHNAGCLLSGSLAPPLARRLLSPGCPGPGKGQERVCGPAHRFLERRPSLDRFVPLLFFLSFNFSFDRYLDERPGPQCQP